MRAVASQGALGLFSSLPSPKSEHIALLQTLSCCPPGKGYVVGTPGPAAAEVFSSCEECGWVECVSFDSVCVWKVTPVGRQVFNLHLAEGVLALEC
jgi:hypothetical protein